MALKFIKLTRPNIKKLRDRQKITEHGITFERFANGDGRYKVNIMVDGQRVHRVVGRESEGVTRHQAEDYIEQVKTEARKERLNLPKGRKPAQRSENGFGISKGRSGLFKSASGGRRQGPESQENEIEPAPDPIF